MNANAKISHWTLALALAGACVGAAAQTTGSDSPVWVDNESFGLASCASAPAAPSNEQVAATMSALRARAHADLGEVLRASGVQLAAGQLVSLTPVEGLLACDGRDSQVNVRVMVVDRRLTLRWAADMTVDAASVDRVALNRLAGELARQFGGVAMAKAN